MIDEKRDLCRVIVENAETDAEKTVAAAEEYARAVKERSDAEVAAYSETESVAIKAETEDVKRKREANARMDAKKQTLLAKTEIVAETYRKALALLCWIGKEEGLSLVDKLIAKYARQGDVIVVGKNSPFTAKDVMKLASAKEKSVSAESGDIGAGIMIKGAKYDRDLTFAAIVDAVREKTETEIAEKLFG